MSWGLLERFIESEVFNQDPHLCVAYLLRYANHIGIHYVLCSKLRSFRYEQIEFFLPQLCHLIVNVPNDSMALEEFILDLCEDSVNATLLVGGAGKKAHLRALYAKEKEKRGHGKTFWFFKTYLHDLSSNPQSEAFKTSRRVFNKLQKIVFGVSGQTLSDNENIKENVLPITVLTSFVLASIGAPILLKWAGPLAIGQARKPRKIEEVISSSRQSHGRISGCMTVSEIKSQSQITGQSSIGFKSAENSSEVVRTSSLDLNPTLLNVGRIKPSQTRRRSSHNDFRKYNLSPIYASLSAVNSRSSDMMIARDLNPKLTGLLQNDPLNDKKFPSGTWSLAPPPLSEAQKVKLLRQNYFRCETLFLTALEDISNKLIVIPKAARLSVLRAELALIAQDLPAEVDIPVICPPNLVNGASCKSRHHRIVRLNPAEATILNSAENVPYLLLVEVLRDDFIFDPNTSDNKALIERLMSEQGSRRRRIFDLSESVRAQHEMHNSSDDVSSSVLKQEFDDCQLSENSKSKKQSYTTDKGMYNNAFLSPGIFSPRTPGIFTSHPSSPSSRSMNFSSTDKEFGPEQTDFSALAIHMRTASQMLNQLENTSGKRPKHEVAAIRIKIIASMQSLEEINFSEAGRNHKLTSFDDMMINAKLAMESNEGEQKQEKEMGKESSHLDIRSGAARTENDKKIGGIQRKADQDDPSAAAFGETWAAKKGRIRNTSPYGWMKNWDILSVIVKTGSDLRQEAFACQLIQVCQSIWKNAKVPVWVERMRILVTGESCGLIETITNGISLHSIKRSLTLAAIESGQNPRRRIASLKDHFLKAFGSSESETYHAAVDAFKRSLAAYSIICYIFQLKDRHNGNVLLDNEGHIIHIDFGFMLSNSPGSVGFEAAPFKLTEDYVDVLGGVSSVNFEDYKQLCKQAFLALRHSADNLIDLVDIMGRDSKMPCFSHGVQQVTTSLRQRFQLQMSADQAQKFVETDLIMKSLGSYYTRLYDTFQYRSQGIY